MLPEPRPSRPLPRLTQAAVPLTREVEVLDEFGQRRLLHIPAERPLTLYVDKREVVTLMTLGSAPELLALGYLRNQQLVASYGSDAVPQSGVQSKRPAAAALGVGRQGEHDDRAHERSGGGRAQLPYNLYDWHTLARRVEKTNMLVKASASSPPRPTSTWASAA